jgi:hypothetical protein
MNHLYDLTSFDTVIALFNQIDGDYIVPDSDKPAMIKLLEEYFWLKENAVPSAVFRKWSEITTLLDTLDTKVKK